MSYKIKYNLAYILLLLLVGIPVGVISNYSKIENSVYSDYFEYKKIESTKEVFENGEDVFFVSHISRKQEGNMKYVDILRCDLGEDYTWFSQSVTYGKAIKEGEIIAIWRYDGNLPKTPAKCFLDSSPTVQLNFGIEKTQKIESNTFIIK